MGTTLTGTTPATTYDSLIKVTDNGPLSGTAKYLSDGLGNDSALALSTGFVGIGTTSAVGSRMELAIGGNVGGSAIQLGRSGTNKATIQLDSSDNLSVEANGAFPIYFATNSEERMRITSAGKVGINTTSALGQLNVKNESAGATTNALALYNAPSNTENTGVAIEFYPNVGVNDRCARISSVNPTTTGTNLSDLRFFTSNNAAPTEKLRITHTGNVGIGTSSVNDPFSASTAVQIGSQSESFGLLTIGGNSQCSIYFSDGTTGVGQYAGYMDYDHSADNFVFGTGGSERFRITNNGVTFNGDTAAANALDDYEEGTWTPTYQGGITGATYSNTSGRYTKIGNAVHWRARIQATAGTAAASQVIIGGFPFTSAPAPETAGCVGYFTIYTTDVIYMYNEANTTNIAAFYKKDGNALIGTDLSNVLGVIHMSGTYFV